MPDPVVIVSRALTTAEVDAEIEDILQRPYSYVLSPESEVGGFAASILEFPGCFAQGETIEGAYANIRSAAKEWLRAVFRLGQEVPCPVDPSARLVPLQLPHDIHAAARREATRQGCSVEDFVTQMVADQFRSDTALVAAIEAAVAPSLDRLKASFVARFPQLEASRGMVKGNKIKAFIYLTTTWPDLEESLITGVHVREDASSRALALADQLVMLIEGAVREDNDAVLRSRPAVA
jgi:predicted RNase H-like HicB family nuclease